MKTVIHNHNTFINGTHVPKSTTTEVVAKQYTPPPGPETPFGMEAGDVASFYRVVVSCPLCSRRQRGMLFLRSWKDLVTLDPEHMVTKSGGPGLIFNDRSPLWDKIARIVDPSIRGKAVDAIVWFFTQMQERSVDAAKACEEAIEKADSLR